MCRRRISADLFRRTLPFDAYDFYMCGPPPFMQGLYDQLTDIGVPDARIHAEAFGPANVLAVRMPYRTSSRESLDHAQLCIDALGIRATTVDISAAVDGYASLDQRSTDGARAMIMARMRMIICSIIRKIRRTADRHVVTNRTAVWLLHLARRRFAAGKPPWRFIEDP
ncbi:MAG: hypothetical protein HC788_13435, partial [Sphingopyxis sp.]|nr:hypothetical protein [Sphingopyxis sp.]